MLGKEFSDKKYKGELLGGILLMKRRIVVLVALGFGLGGILAARAVYDHNLIKSSKRAVDSGNFVLAEHLIATHKGLGKELLDADLVESLNQKKPAAFLGLSVWARAEKLTPSSKALNHAIVRNGFFRGAPIPADLDAVDLYNQAQKDGVKIGYLEASKSLYILAKSQLLKTASAFSGQNIYHISWTRLGGLHRICTSSIFASQDTASTRKLYADVGHLLAYYGTATQLLHKKVAEARQTVRRLKRKLNRPHGFRFFRLNPISNNGRTADQMFMASNSFFCFPNSGCRHFIVELSPREFAHLQRIWVSPLSFLSGTVEEKSTDEILNPETGNETSYPGYKIGDIHLAVRKGNIREQLKEEKTIMRRLRESLTEVRGFDCMYGEPAEDVGGLLCQNTEPLSPSQQTIVAQYESEQALVESIMADASVLKDADGSVTPLHVEYQFPGVGYFSALSSSPKKMPCTSNHTTKQSWAGLTFYNVPQRTPAGHTQWRQYIKVNDLYYPLGERAWDQNEPILSACHPSLMNNYMTRFSLLTGPSGQKVAVVYVEAAGGTGSMLSVGAYRIGKTGVSRILAIEPANGNISFVHGEMLITGTVAPPGEPLADAVPAEIAFGWSPLKKDFVPAAAMKGASVYFYQSLGQPIEDVPITGRTELPN